MGKQENEIGLPELDALDTVSLEKMRIKSSEPEMPLHDVEVDIAQDLGGSGGKMISSFEAQEIDLLEEARESQIVSGMLDQLGAESSLMPQVDAHGTPLGVGVATGSSGVQLSKMSAMMASSFRMTADVLTYRANRIGKIGSYARREQEWALQSKLAAGEITHVYKQLRAGQIREAIAKRERKNHQQQMRQAEEIESPLTDVKTRKTTNRAFYTWMRREVKGLYGQCFQFAFDIARKAEQALQHELGDPELSYLQFDYETIADVIMACAQLSWMMFRERPRFNRRRFPDCSV